MSKRYLGAGISFEQEKVYQEFSEDATPSGGGSLATLTDVDISDPTDGQVLIYNATTRKWKNGAGGGGIFIITGTDGGDGVVLDKTYTEIKNAYLSGASCVINTVEDYSEPESIAIDNVSSQIVALIEEETGEPGDTSITYVIMDGQGNRYSTETPSGYPNILK